MSHNLPLLDQSNQSLSRFDEEDAVWSQDEDQSLIDAVNESYPNAITDPAKAVNTIHWVTFTHGDKTPQALRERWYELVTGTSRSSKSAWSDDEDMKIIQLHQAVGTKWTEYSKALPGRQENAIKNRWNSTTRRVIRYETGLKKQGLVAIKSDVENQVLFKYCRQQRALNEPAALPLDENGLTLLDLTKWLESPGPAPSPNSSIMIMNYHIEHSNRTKSSTTNDLPDLSLESSSSTAPTIGNNKRAKPTVLSMAESNLRSTIPNVDLTQKRKTPKVNNKLLADLIDTDPADLPVLVSTAPNVPPLTPAELLQTTGLRHQIGKDGKSELISYRRTLPRRRPLISEEALYTTTIGRSKNSTYGRSTRSTTSSRSTSPNQHATVGNDKMVPTLRQDSLNHDNNFMQIGQLQSNLMPLHHTLEYGTRTRGLIPQGGHSTFGIATSAPSAGLNGGGITTITTTTTTTASSSSGNVFPNTSLAVPSFNSLLSPQNLPLSSSQQQQQQSQLQHQPSPFPTLGSQNWSPLNHQLQNLKGTQLLNNNNNNNNNNHNHNNTSNIPASPFGGVGKLSSSLFGNSLNPNLSSNASTPIPLGSFSTQTADMSYKRQRTTLGTIPGSGTITPNANNSFVSLGSHANLLPTTLSPAPTAFLGNSAVKTASLYQPNLTTNLSFKGSGNTKPNTQYSSLFPTKSPLLSQVNSPVLSRSSSKDFNHKSMNNQSSSIILSPVNTWQATTQPVQLQPQVQLQPNQVTQGGKLLSSVFSHLSQPMQIQQSQPQQPSNPILPPSQPLLSSPLITQSSMQSATGPLLSFPLHQHALTAQFSAQNLVHSNTATATAATTNNNNNNNTNNNTNNNNTNNNTNNNNSSQPQLPQMLQPPQQPPQQQLQTSSSSSSTSSSSSSSLSSSGAQFVAPTNVVLPLPYPLPPGQTSTTLSRTASGSTIKNFPTTTFSKPNGKNLSTGMVPQQSPSQPPLQREYLNASSSNSFGNIVINGNNQPSNSDLNSANASSHPSIASSDGAGASPTTSLISHFSNVKSNSALKFLGNNAQSSHHAPQQQQTHP